MTTETSDTIVVQEYYIRKLEENVVNLTKSKIILETNIDVFTKMVEQRDDKFREINAKNFELNDTIGNLTTRHQEEIELLKQGFEAKFGELHYEAMKEVEKTQREKNELAADLHARINDKQREIDEYQIKYNDITFRYTELEDQYNNVCSKYDNLRKESVAKTNIQTVPKAKDKYKLGKSNNNTGM